MKKYGNRNSSQTEWGTENQNEIAVEPNGELQKRQNAKV